jgi:hypothetical protein
MSKWISVGKEMPKRKRVFGCSENVLVINEFGDMVTAWYQFKVSGLKNTIEGYEIGWHASLPQSDFGPLSGITHWMQKPKAPK